VHGLRTSRQGPPILVHNSHITVHVKRCHTKCLLRPPSITLNREPSVSSPQSHLLEMPTQVPGLRPGTSLSEHVAREIERDYPGYLTTQKAPPKGRGPLKRGAKGIKRFVFATAGGVKRVSIATGRKSVNVNRKFGRSVKRFAKWAYDEWSYPTQTRKKCTYSHLQC
jgi:hypothetical protein